MRLVSLAKKYRVDILLVLALFMLSFGIRAAPADRFPNIYGFDSYWAARMTKYLITGENLVQKGWPFANVPDYTVDYPFGRQGTLSNELGFWLANANLYKIAASIVGVSGFDYDLFGRLDNWMNAIYGSLAIPAIYLFGRVAFGRWAGLGSALFLAFSTNHLFYSIFGHAENDALGFSLFFISLFAMVATVKKRDMRYGLLSTFFLTWTSLVWQTYEVIAVSVSAAVVLYFMAYALLSQAGYYKNSPERTEHRKWMVYGLLFALASSIVTTFIYRTNYGATGISCFGFAILFASLVEFLISGKAKSSALSGFYPGKTLAISAAWIAVGFAIFGMLMISLPLNRMGIDVSFGAQPAPWADYESRMIQTIAEQNPIAGGDFINRVSTLASSGFGIAIWLSLFAVVLALAKMCIMPIIRKDFTYEWDMFVVIFILPSLYMLTSKAVNVFFLAAATSLGAGYFFATVLRLFEVLGKHLAGFAVPAKAATFAVMLMGSFGFMMIMVPNADGFGYDVNAEWWSVFKFLNSPSVPAGSVITAWWDYGHWMAYFNGEKVHITQDNIQDRKDIIYTVASSFTHTPECRYDSAAKQITCETSEQALERAELESLSLLKPLNTTHILIDQEIVGGTTGGKFGALEHIADNQIGCMQTIGCSTRDDNTTACIFGKDSSGKDIGFTFAAGQWELLKTVPWPGINFAEQGLPARVFGRETSGGRMLFMSALGCGSQFQPDANSPVLYGFTQRLYFKDLNLKHVKLVYDDGWNVIYEVNWTGVPDPKNFTAWTKEHSVLPPCTDTCAPEAISG